jgi:hypothetical protein
VFHYVCIKRAAKHGQLTGQNHTCGYRLTVKPVAIALNPLDGVTESVSIIQVRPHATLALIGSYNGGLNRATALDRKRQRRRLPALQRSTLSMSQAKNPASRMRPYLMISG